MRTYREFRFWSVTLGCDAVRLSMPDAHGGELFKIVPVRSGFVVDANAKRVPQYRVDRDAALDEIEDAISRGDEPGEVGNENRQEA